MAEPNILLTRIDNRLVHGQVATQWNSTLGSNLILVANDDVATNTMRQNLMKMAAPAGVASRFFSLQKTIDVIGKASPRQQSFNGADTPHDEDVAAFKELQEWGVEWEIRRVPSTPVEDTSKLFS